MDRSLRTIERPGRRLSILVLGLGILIWILFIALSLAWLQLPLLWIVAGTAVLIAFLSTSVLRSRTVIYLLLFFAMFLNVANYSFLTFTSTGELSRGAESEAAAILRLPLVLLAVAVVFRSKGAEFARYLGHNWDVCLLAATPFFGVFFAFDQTAALQYATWFFLSLVAILGLLVLLRDEVPSWRWMDHMAWLLLLGNCLMVVFAVMNVPKTLSGESVYLRTSYADSNIHAVFSSVVLAALLVIERQKSLRVGSRLLDRIPGWAILGTALLIVVPLVLSGKRSAMGSAGIVVLIYLMTGATSGRRAGASGVIRAVLVVASIALAVSIVLPKAEFTRMRLERTLDSEMNTSVQQRVVLLQLGHAVFEEYPVFGVGLRNSSIATTRLANFSEEAGWTLHNTYLTILVEMGAIGGLAFLIVAFRSFLLWSRLRDGPMRVGIAMLLIPPLLVAMTENALTPGQAMFWPFWLTLLLPRTGVVYRKQLGKMPSSGGSQPPRNTAHVFGHGRFLK